MKIIPHWLHKNYQSPISKKLFRVQLCQIKGRPTLVYERRLLSSGVDLYEKLCVYACLNGYDVSEDRRKQDIQDVTRIKDRRSSSTISMILMTSCLFSSLTYADSLSKESSLNDYYKNYAPATSYEQVTDKLLSLNINAGSNLEQSLMTALIMWINSNSSLSYSINELPKIEFVNNIEMQNIAFGKVLPASIGLDSRGILGLYNFHNQKIYLLDSLDLNLEHERAILLHELVHFLQFQNGDDSNVKCKNELEKLAYRLEEKYLQSINQSTGLNRNHQIEQLSQCA